MPIIAVLLSYLILQIAKLYCRFIYILNLKSVLKTYA